MTPLDLRPRPLARALFALLLLVTGFAHAATPTNVVITQIYGGGGNSGATISYDYVEIFNPTGNPINLNGYSVQYAAVTGTSYQVAPLGNFILQPGEYYLVGGNTSGTNTGGPSPDVALNINMSGTNGKVALVSSVAALSGTSGCPTGGTVVDYVGYGPSASCHTGAAGTPILSNTTAAVRTDPCVAPTNNASDFTASAPSPHNSSSAFATCGGGPVHTPLASSGSASPSTVYNTNTTFLTVSVVPATLPSSTGITVKVDLSAIGGSAAQPFYDDGTNGDVTAGDNIYTYTASANAVGTFSLPVTVTDQQSGSPPAAIALTVKTLPGTISIRSIQSAKPSPNAGQTVTTSGIVIGVKYNGFYLAAKDADTSPVTPEGILVYTGSSRLPSYIVVGAEVQVTGTVSSYPTYSTTPGTEIDSPTYTLLTTGNPLPTPIHLTADRNTATGGIRQLSKYEGMRVTIDSITTTSGTYASLNEVTETNTSYGSFYGVFTGTPRPFREPGLSVLDATYTTPVPASIPLWDSNPEIIQFDTGATGGTPLDLTSNVTVTNISGVMDFSTGSPEVIIDAANRPTVTTPNMVAQPVPVKAAGEFTVASFNMERFYNDLADADNPGSSGIPTVTTAAYQRRLNKASLAIRNILNFPDIIGAQEIENLAVLTDLANKVSADAVTAGQTDPVYKPYLFLANDGTAINTGFLVKSTTVDTLNVEQFGLTTTFINSIGNQAILNDRTPLVLHAGIKRTGGKPDYNVTVIDVHQRSLSGVDDPSTTGQTVRLKREKQAEYLASLIQGYQANGEHVITVGDYNSFEFSDGFVDVLGVTRGNPVPSTQVIVPPATGLANPPLVDLVTLLPAAQRQSYVESGSAQVLDHVVVTADLVPTETRLVYAHMDSDFPLVYLNDATRPERVSDHDPAVAYFTVPVLAPAITLSATSINFGNQGLTTTSAQSITVTNSGNYTLNIASVAVTGTAFRQLNTCTAPLAPAATCTINVTFAPTTVAAVTGSLVITSDASTSPTTVSLAGSGGDFTITPLTSSITITAGGTAAFPLSITPLGGLSGTITFSCSTLAKGETCSAPSSTLAAASTAGAVVTVTTTTSTLFSRNTLPSHRSGVQMAGMAFGALSLLALAGTARRKRLGNALRLLSLCAVLATLGALTGCNGDVIKSGTPNPNGTPTGTQTITITATAAGVTHTTTVTLIVQ